MPPESTDFIDYITGPERPPLTRRWMNETRHTHGSLDPMNWSIDPLTRHLRDEHGVWVGIQEEKPGLVERHAKMHPEGEDRSTEFV